MTKSRIRKADLLELLTAYRDAARAHGIATEKGDYKVGNRAADLLVAIYAELRRRGRDSQNALLRLLADDDLGVRLWAASHALEFSPSDGERVLRELVPLGRSLGLSAETTLEEWRRGTLRFP